MSTCRRYHNSCSSCGSYWPISFRGDDKNVTSLQIDKECQVMAKPHMTTILDLGKIYRRTKPHMTTILDLGKIYRRTKSVIYF